MTTANSRGAIAHDLQSLEEVQSLLGRYPEVDQHERDRIAHFLRRGSPIDIGLLSSNPEVWRAASTFKAQHPSYFSISTRVYIGWIIAIASLAAVMLFIKDMGAT